MIAQEVFMDIFTLHRQGHSARSIAKKLGLSRTTVNKYLKQGEFPKYTQGKRRESILSPYKQVIQDFLAEDAYRATWIFERIQEGPTDLAPCVE